MNFNVARLYELLPAVYRLRDHQQGEPLKSLLWVIAEQVAVIEEDLAQLYDDQFIETCSDWVVPYIGELVGHPLKHSASEKGTSLRAEVANTIAYRRRKGTPAMLEQMAHDVTGWHARVVEFFQFLAYTQHMSHVRPENWYAPALRRRELCERANTAFDNFPHTADVRSMSSGGKYNIANVGIFLWRAKAQAANDCPPGPRITTGENPDKERFHFHPLGVDVQLFTKPQAEDEITHLAQPLNVPNPISHRVLEQHLGDYYGENKSFLIKVDGKEVAGDRLRICDLSDIPGSTEWREWRTRETEQNVIAVDPVLGRLSFSRPPASRVTVSFHFGLGADLGGGGYDRAPSFNTRATGVRTVPEERPTIEEALSDLREADTVKINDSGRYEEELAIKALSKPRFELRAANSCFPTIILRDTLEIDGDQDSTVTLNGLLIAGHPLHLRSNLRLLRLRHCTLMPGWPPPGAGDPEEPNPSSLLVESQNIEIEIDHCIILGSLRLDESAIVRISNSIVDATQRGVAFGGPDNLDVGGSLSIQNSTIIGSVQAEAMPLVSNSILLNRSISERRQEGCVRFSFLGADSQTPPCCQCVLGARGIAPAFTSLVYGHYAYCQLSRTCPKEIREGADDGAEMGVFHELCQPQREKALQARLADYLPLRLEAGIFYVT